MEEILINSREDIAKAKRIVIKAGTSIVSTPLGFPSLPRMANIVEHAADLVRAGKEVIIVTSGAIGVGKQKLRHQSKYKNYGDEGGNLLGPKTYNAAAAAAGQLGLMSLYATMFDQHDITTSQLLVTSFDFASPERCQTVRNVMEQLLHLGIVPLLNENDAVSGNQGYELFGNTFSDNDSLAAIVAGGIQAQLLIILTDVQGVYDRPPSHPQAKVIHTYTKQTEFEVGSKSLQGRGGMGAKVDAAMKAIRGGVPAVVIAAGGIPETIPKILSGEEWGTLFLGANNDLIDCTTPETTNPTTPSSTAAVDAPEDEFNEKNDKKTEKIVRSIAEGSRNGCRAIQKVDSEVRERILEEIALSLEAHKAEILAANQLDLDQATIEGLSGQLLKRLKLTEQKIDSLVDGIRCIAKQAEPLGQILSRTELSENLILDKVSCPIGVLLIIFESRPDCLPQIVACAIRSGNGIVLKGGREAEHSNQFLHKLVTEAIERGSDGKVPGSLVGLVTSRAEIPLLLKMDDVIDLVIPRGSATLVRYIKDQTRIPVMGHAEGICHVFIDSEADPQKAIAVAVDAKIDYPAACNAMETLLLHRETLQNGVAEKVLSSLRAAGVEILGSAECLRLGLAIRHVEDFSNEYSDLVVSLEIVENVDGAIAHIHKFGSAHTESIITENQQTAEKFLQEVDSACVFHNASTRFADGYRFGLGAEVGISTGRIGARGPVGVEGLLSFKWKLRSSDPAGHTVGSFSDNANPRRYYNFKSLPTEK